MLKPILLLAIVFIFGVQLRAQYPDEPPMNPISPTEYQYHFWKLQLKYSPYFQGHQSEISLPRNHNSNHEYKSRDCDLILKDMKLLVTPKQKGNCWIFQFDKKAKKNVDSISIFVSPYPKPTVVWGYGTNQFVYGYKNVLSPNGDRIRTLMPHELKNPHKVISWKIQIGKENFEFDNDSIPEFFAYKIYTQNSKLVNCPVEIICENKFYQKVIIHDTLEFINWYFKDNFETTKIRVIEKNESNYEALFNANNSLSLMSLLKNNCFRSVGLIVPQTVERNIPKFHYEFKYSILGSDSDIPIQTKSGEDSIYENSYLYPPREQIFYDLDEITHILIVDELNATEFGQSVNTRLILAKKYNRDDKLELVFSITLEELYTQFLGNTILNVSKSHLHLIWDEHLEIVKTLKKCRENLIDANQNNINSLRAEHCSNFSYFPQYMDVNLCYKPTEIEYENPRFFNIRIFNFAFWDKFEFIYSNEFKNMFQNEFKEPLDNFELLKENQLSFMWDFIVSEYGEYEPITKEYKEKLLNNPQSLYYAFSKNVNAYQVMQYNDTRDTLITKHMFFTSDYKGFEIPYLLFTLPNTSEFNFIRNFNAIPIAQLPWKIELEKTLSQSKVYDPNNKADLQKLDALFYLDSFEGKPLNMLNVCVGCSEH